MTGNTEQFCDEEMLYPPPPGFDGFDGSAAGRDSGAKRSHMQLVTDPASATGRTHSTCIKELLPPYGLAIEAGA